MTLWNVWLKWVIRFYIKIYFKLVHVNNQRSLQQLILWPCIIFLYSVSLDRLWFFCFFFLCSVFFFPFLFFLRKKLTQCLQHAIKYKWRPHTVGGKQGLVNPGHVGVDNVFPHIGLKHKQTWLWHDWALVQLYGADWHFLLALLLPVTPFT